MAKEGDPPVSMNAKNIESAIYGAASHTLGLENRKKLGGLTRDMAAAIYLYTMDTNFYKIINALLRDDERDPLKSFFPYLKLVMTGLRRLEKQETEVYRGVALPLSLLDGAEHYIPGNVVVWWPFSSSSVSRDVLADPLFLGTSGKRTLFTIKVSTARDIRAYSWKAKENELLILPGTPFKVASVDTVGDLTTIHLEEDVDAPDMIDSGDDTYEMVDFKDAQEGFYDLAGDAYDAIEDGSGGGGAADAYDLVADQRVGVNPDAPCLPSKFRPWDYRGKSRKEWTDHLVANNSEGFFVVRDTDKAFAALTFVVIDANNAMNLEHHSRLIVVCEGAKVAVDKLRKLRKHQFNSIAELIVAYRDLSRLYFSQTLGRTIPSVPLMGYL